MILLLTSLTKASQHTQHKRPHKKSFCYDRNMNYKIIILAPSAGRKSTLMQHLREHSKLKVAETDEEVTKANNGVWPDDEYKNNVLILKLPTILFCATT